MRPTYRRLRNLLIFGLPAGAAGYLLASLAIAHAFVYALGHPPCNSNPRPLAGFPPPDEASLRSSGDGLRLRAWYYPPANGSVIITTGGAGGTLGQNAPPIDFLLQAGYGALQIDSRACAVPPAVVTLGANEIYDVYGAVDWLEARPEVKRIGIYGFSMGGVTAIRSAARIPTIQAVIAEGGYANLERTFHNQEHPTTPLIQPFMRWMGVAFRLEYGIDPQQVSPLHDIDAISPRPVLLIYGSEERSLSDGRLQYEAAGQPKELWIVPGGTHGGNYALHPEEYRQRVLAFFDRYLR